MLKIGRQFAVTRAVLPRAGMDKLEMRSMECNAIDELLRGFHPMVFSVADDRVPEGRKLDTDLILIMPTLLL